MSKIVVVGSCNIDITVECDGTDEQAMLDEAIALIESGFGE